MLNVPDPIAVALNAMGPSFFWVSSIVKIAVLAGLASVVLVQILGQTRVFLAVGKDGLLPKRMSKINAKTRTPIVASITAVLACMILAGTFPVEILAQLVSMLTLFIFGIVCLGVWILRHTHPEFKRPFKVPLVPWVPLLGILVCLGQMLCLPLITWGQFGFWLIVGFLIYFSYGIKHSVIRVKHTERKD